MARTRELFQPEVSEGTHFGYRSASIDRVRVLQVTGNERWGTIQWDTPLVWPLAQCACVQRQNIDWAQTTDEMVTHSLQTSQRSKLRAAS